MIDSLEEWIGSESRPILALMSFIKLGDFLLLTPALQEIQNHYPQLIMSVPDMLWDLYCEAHVFGRCLPAYKVDRFLDESRLDPLILDLTYPLLDKVQVSEKHLKLNPRFFEGDTNCAESYIKSLRLYFPELPLDFEVKPFMSIDLDEQVLNEFSVHSFRYFTVHSGSDFSGKNWPAQSFETTIEIILENYPDLVCLNLVGPQDHQLFDLASAPQNFRVIRTDLRKVAHLLAGGLFHLDNDSGIHQLAGALDVPCISVFGPTGPDLSGSLSKRNFIHWGGASCPHFCRGAKVEECEEKICLTSVKPAFLAESARKILSAYEHLEI